VFASNDGVTWGDPVKTGVMPSARAVQYLDLGLTAQRPRYVKLEVDDTWALANAPRFFHQLQIDEMWLGWGYPTSASAASVTGYEAEAGAVHGNAHTVACDTCSGGAKVTNIGNDTGNDVTLTVNTDRGGDYLLTIVGSVAGTRSLSVSVNGARATSVPMTGSSFVSPLIARSIVVQLHAHANTIRLGNDTAYAPDLDRITLSRVDIEDD
jgi:alpha-L-fucosidase